MPLRLLALTIQALQVMCSWALAKLVMRVWLTRAVTVRLVAHCAATCNAVQACGSLECGVTTTSWARDMG